MSAENYVLTESFNIDDGQIDGLSPQECFVLGYELANISARAEFDQEEFTAMIHAANERRISTALAKRNRRRIMTWMPNDLTEGWLKLTVLESK